MFCIYCGKEIADGSAFCRYCGRKIVQETPPQAPPVIDTPQTCAESEKTSAVSPTKSPSEQQTTCEPSDKETESKGAQIAAAAVVLLIVLLALAGIYWFISIFWKGILALLLVVIVLAAGAAVCWLIHETKQKHREGTNLDEDNVCYEEWKEVITAEKIPPAEVRGYLDPKRIARADFPVWAPDWEKHRTALREYFFEPDFFKTARLGNLVVGKRVFWILSAILLVTVCFLPIWLIPLEAAAAAAVYYLAYYVGMYYPGLVNMACVPHFLPVGITEQDAANRIVSALRQKGISVEEREGRFWIEATYPLCFQDGGFHIDFPAGTQENHKSDHFKKLAVFNATAARALFPERMYQPLLPMADVPTRYPLWERIIQIIYVAGAALLVLGVLVSGGWFNTPADDIQKTYWDYSAAWTIGEAFQRNYQNALWEDYTVNGGPGVKFSGDASTEMGDIQVTILFSYDEQEDRFSLEKGAVNQTWVSYGTVQDLMKFGYDGDTEDLVSSILAEGIFQGLMDAFL